MSLQARQRGLRLWLAILAIYGMLLHAPAMAAMGHVGDDPVATAAHQHDDAAAPHHDGQSAEDCCIVCFGGPCAVGPVGPGGIVLPLPLARARRLRIIQPRRELRGTRSSWFEARGPPRSARSPLQRR